MPPASPTFGHPDDPGYIIAGLGDSSLVTEAEGIVRFFFPLSAEAYRGLELEEYRALVAAAQDELNKREIARRIALALRAQLEAILGSTDVLVQSNLYLRATRPQVAAAQESVGWHREVFYGKDMEMAVNVWTPVLGVCAENTLRFVPGSHTIPDDRIEVRQQEDEQTPRHSAGHKIGLLYAPKTIVGGVDFSRQERFIVLPGESAIFSAQLIHGAAANQSDRIRFSVDFRVIAAENYKANKQHFASGKTYFEPI